MIPEPWDIESRRNAMQTAQWLLETGAVRYDPQNPCRHGSGLVSPLHVEGRLLLSHPGTRGGVIRLALRMIEEEVTDARLDAVAAAEGAGVPFATLIADRLGLPLVFVRKEGREPCSYKDRLEGPVEPGWNLLLVEQLATDGHRKARFAEPLTQAGCRVAHAFVLFQYGIFDAIHDHLAKLGITLHALCTWWDILDAAAAGHFLDARAQAEIEAFLADPRRWTADHTTRSASNAA
ncbi:orotate phosphoribosyltransferase [Azospirillum sp. RWY-5-1]|uniref:Orotate phosphoribosyltransferase n=1 Tax=Azospirillum oleiclasticum TaxID=2735135 RepID=A0ABX2T8J5_9PROT|nr:orotate phosphoribosyltransferase [Azospirillum oleiclasticum]NYZ13202.1 orotate phosphoribosyltransferase [Azospirillum oleiclasticum]NYZ20125.1 orotate phosphoribosyltransferase [Azospirillum oleiclasticum]